MAGKRLIELDGLRGIAALAVVLFHFLYNYNDKYGHSFAVFEFIRFGNYGVHLFFIISGFAIYWTISRTDSAMDYVVARFSRIYPAFWAAVTTTFVVVTIFSLPGRERDFVTYLANLSLIHEFFGFPHVDGVYWTLTLELTFYFWILVIFCLRQINNIEKILVAWVLAACCFNFLVSDFGLKSAVEKLFLLKYIELFAAGICFYKYKEGSHSKWTTVLLILSAVVLYANYNKTIFALITCFYLLFFLIVVDKASILRHRILVYLGSISYTLYLIHQNIGYIIINYSYEFGLSPVFGVSLALLVAITLAHLLSKYIEKPSMKVLRERYRTGLPKNSGHIL